MGFDLAIGLGWLLVESGFRRPRPRTSHVGRRDALVPVGPWRANNSRLRAGPRAMADSELALSLGTPQKRP